jgi:hypothetical protein
MREKLGVNVKRTTVCLTPELAIPLVKTKTHQQQQQQQEELDATQSRDKWERSEKVWFFSS